MSRIPTTTGADLAAFQNATQKTFPNWPAAQRDWDRCPGRTTGIMQYLKPLPKWDVEKPFNLTLPLPAGQPHTNSIMETHEIALADVRGREAVFSLDVHGFAFADRIPSLPVPQAHDHKHEHERGQGQAQTSYDKDDEAFRRSIEDEYLPQVEAFVRDRMGADRVVAFDYTLRQTQKLGAPPSAHSTGVVMRGPARNSHADQTPESALRRLHLFFGNEVEELIKGRVQLVNLWRPLFGPIRDYPLAVLDARTLASDNLVAQDQILPHHFGEIYLLKFDPRQRWYYWSDMQQEEAILIKNFDSFLGGTARLCPHGAFQDVRAPPDARPRESIEVRCIVFHDDNNNIQPHASETT